MSFEDFEKFLAELDGNGEHKIMLMDFISLGGIAGYDATVQKIMLEQDLNKYIFRLAIPYHEDCQFVKRYKVTKPSTIVAVSVSDSNKHISYSQSQVDHDPEAQLSQLIAFIRLVTNSDRKQ